MLIGLVALALLVASGSALIAWRALEENRQRSEARVAALASMMDVDVAEAPASPVAVASLFKRDERVPSTRNPRITAAVIGAMLVGFAALVFVEGRKPDGARPVSANVVAPLELMSLRHMREGDHLTISGLVRNPVSGAPVARLTAVVSVYDKGGAFVTSARAPIDFLSLEPGYESPFIISIPNVTDVGRYRVTFRTEARLLRHVDRRSEQVRVASARK